MDTIDWKTYGISYEMDGDKAVLDFENVKRKKLAYVDYDEGEEQDFRAFADNLAERVEAKYTNTVDELNTLKEKFETIKKNENKDAVNELFSKFDESLNSFDDYKTLKENFDAETGSVKELESKLFELKGRHDVQFSLESNESGNNQSTPTRLRFGADIVEPENKPYGNLFDGIVKE